MTSTQDDLRLQFEAIQEKQKKKFVRIKQQQAAKSKQQNGDNEESLTLSDDLGLMGADTMQQDQLKNEFQSAKEEYTNRIRSLEDENGRLLQLVKEKEVEAKLLRKKWEKDKILLETFSAGSTSDAASTKIVELSKKVRELNAELESERNKNRLSTRRIYELSNQLQNGGSEKPREILDEEKLQLELKATSEKLRQSELKMAEYRNQNSSLKQELKLAQKALSNEIGENTSVQAVLKSDSTWRGRSQQILSLQQKVSELKSQLEGSEMDFGTGSAVSGRRTATLDIQHKDQIRKLEKDRKENLQKMGETISELEKERDDLKGKLDASKARNKVLSNEIKSLKNQTQTLLTKNNHDNELIQALMKQIEQLQKGLVSATKNKSDSSEKFNKNMSDLKVQSEQYLNRIKQLENTIRERDDHLIELENEFDSLKRKTSQSKTHFTQKTSRLSQCRIEHNIAVVTIDSEEMGSARRNSSRLSSRSSSRLAETPRADIEHYKVLSQTAQVERDKLVELIGVMQKRVQDSEEKRLQSEQHLKSERKKTAILEKQVGRLKSEGRKLEETETDLLATKIDDLENDILFKSDEIDMLKMALDRSISAKEEDLKIYQQVIEQTKSMFIKAVRQK
ncbi:DgyrCDS8450 [Dimorphilus gyrociliatus]|uniref:DgyrCDS8450 n=1 Tax=Dimorphilus gyrociliatus TaxID=2664684 RepID=A0A7I8VWE4_9ANNE|nr:DgyrCDS8450 [Dimorphilus gyrociliatus]